MAINTSGCALAYHGRDGMLEDTYKRVQRIEQRLVRDELVVQRLQHFLENPSSLGLSETHRQQLIDIISFK